MGWAKLDVDVIAREWRGYWQTGISPLAGWLPERDKPWRATVAPPALPQGHLAQGWPPFRNLIFDPALRETLLAVVGTLDSAELEAWWLEQLAAQPFLCEVGLQCLAQCQSEQALAVGPLLQNLCTVNAMSPVDSELGLLPSSRARNPENEAAVMAWLQRGEDGGWCQRALERLRSREWERNYQPKVWIPCSSFPTLEEAHHLLEALRGDTSPPQELRCQLPQNVGVKGFVEAVPLLLECLDSDEFRAVGMELSFALGRIQSPDVVPPILERLVGEADAERRRHYLFVLESCTVESQMPLLSGYLPQITDPEARRSFFSILGHLRFPGQVSLLLEHFPKEIVMMARREIVMALGDLGSKEAITILMATLQNKKEDPLILWACASALADLAATEAIPLLLECLQTEDYRPIATSTLCALEELAAPEAVPVLLECLKNEDDKILRGILSRALGTSVQPSHIPLLLECLQQDDYHRVSAYLINALACLGSAAVDALCAAQPECLEAVFYLMTTSDPHKSRLEQSRAWEARISNASPSLP
nr:HEAT repeat domain-containing protein [Armatimonas sp.]